MVEVSPDLARALPVGQALGEYVIQRKLAEGGFGAIYVAASTKLEGRQVIVKTMRAWDEDSQALLRREAKQLVNLHHPAVVQVISYGEEAGFQYLVMEHVDAPTLAAIHREGGALGPFEVVRLGTRIAEALEAVHEVNVVHRDLKPDNIMVKLSRDRGRYVDWLKLIDFGLAHQAGATDAIRAGTVAYVAPETLMPELSAVTPATDLYSLGCILFELLTAQAPYVGDTQQVVNQHAHAKVPRLRDLRPDLPEALDELVFRLMQKQPKDRPASAAEVRRTLTKIERDLSDGATGMQRLSAVLGRPTELPKAAVTEPMGTVKKPVEPTLKVDRLPVPPLEGDAPKADVAPVPVAAVPPQSSSRAGLMVAALGAVVGGALLVWVLMQGGGPKPTGPVDPAMGVTVAPPPAKVEPVVVPAAPVVAPAATPAMEDPVAALPVPVAKKPEVAKPVAVVAPVVAAAPVEVPKPTVQPAPVVTAPPACTFDDGFVKYARKQVTLLRAFPKGSTSEFEAGADRVGESLVEKNCQKAQAGLAALQRLVGAPEE